MRLSSTLSLYLGRQFLVGIGFVFGVVMLLVFLVDVVNLLGQAANEEEASFGIVVQMSLLKLPTLSEKLLPFATLFGGIWTFSRLTRTHELIVARANGVSVWQFLMPALALAALIGLFVVAVYNPIASAMVARFERLEAKYLDGRASLLTFSKAGLWLRQADVRGQSVIHAMGAGADGMELRDVIIFLYRGADEFVGRIDAASAKLEAGYWQLHDVLLTGPDRAAQRQAAYRLPTSLTAEQIRESFASPETLSFWALPQFIEALDASGFSAVRHRLHWHSVLATPLLLCAMVLLAATFSLRLNRYGHTGILIGAGAFAGLALYVISDIVHALGTAGSVPVILAAWTPTGVSSLLGLAMLFHLEDG